MSWAFGRLKPQSIDEVKLAETINGKRALIERHVRESSLVANVFNAARYQGLSGEDKYVWLAYEALIRLEQLQQVYLEFVNLHPNPLVVTCTADDVDRDFDPKVRTPFTPFKP